jgi:hypothetical protein
MKRQNTIILIVVLILIVIVVGYLVYYQINRNNFIIVGGDRDEHGCIGSAGYQWCESKQKCLRIWEETCDSNNSIKNYCTPEQKKAQICPEYYSATCGWFNSSIKCIKYPCAQTFSNSCFACADDKVEYYTIGECPMSLS